jgi:hypothetical protein
MNFNPLTIRYGYHAALWRGRRKRNWFSRRIDSLAVCNGDASLCELPIDLVCMLGSTAIPEVIVAVRSFLMHAGRPIRLLLVSDGTLSTYDTDLLESTLISCQVVELPDILNPTLPNSITTRLPDHWMIRKQALLMSLPKDRPALFVDSDIVFFPAAQELGADLASLGANPAYMVDLKPSFDHRLLRDGDELTPPLNSGLLYMPRPLNWSNAVNRFESLPSDAKLVFTDQTMSHLAFHEAGAMPLHPDRYMLRIDDQFEYRDRYTNKPGVVCRHYVNTIRHKMWGDCL